MLYIIGGASRSGKTLLSRRFVSEKQIPYFPLDALFGALAHGAPEFKVKYESSFIERSEKLWKLSEHLFNFFAEEEKDYLMEGDTILPSQIHKLITEGKSIKSCFLGYPTMTAEEKLAFVRNYHQGERDWTKNYSDEEMLLMINEMVEFSKVLQKQCEEYGIAFFDISHDFESAHNEVFDYLFEN
jgi:hypothetical protein